MGIIGERTKKRRHELGLSQNQLVERVNAVAGKSICSQPKLGQLENGETQHPRYLVELAEALEVSLDWLRGGALMEGGVVFSDHPNAAAAASARTHKADIVRAITAAPDLFAALMTAYRQLYREEGVSIAEAELIALVLDDYAELVTECATPEERRILANGFAVKQRGWLRRNKGRIGA